MASPRKQITYARKRSKPIPSRDASLSSSPINQLDDPDHYISFSELSRRLRKRARSDPEGTSSKRFKPSAPMSSPNSHLHTLPEEPTLQTHGFSIPPESSYGSPAARRAIARTASKNLKENVSGGVGGRSVTKSAKSPFRSRPNSTASSPQKPHLAPVSIEPLTNHNFNPNLPEHMKAADRPHAHSSSSAPSPPRPDLTFDVQTALAAPRSPSTTNEAALNPNPTRPSFHAESGSQFFSDAQGTSTPRKNIARDLQLQQDAAPPSGGVHFGATRTSSTTRERERSPWLSDSIVSPPASHEWIRVPQQREPETPSTCSSVEILEGVSGLAPGPALSHEWNRVPQQQETETTSARSLVETSAPPPVVADPAQSTSDTKLKPIFDGLALGMSCT
ncbi:hypothetical protein DFH07DRAFT_980486 [Mycena maculata]|uniref:Uncharacterized protein n=1 Tax=Mycena maculata TaxID=230809 RepID=A0AAD7IFV6_9AGAR|nr:hypothetical protein DFH07DRAFT_980486 [Mycena maculata]